MLFSKMFGKMIQDSIFYKPLIIVIFNEIIWICILYSFDFYLNIYEWYFDLEDS